MLDSTHFTPSRIELHPLNKGSPIDHRTSPNGWSVTPTDKPSFTLNLGSLDGTQNGVLEKVDMPGNVKTVTIKYTTEPPHDDSSHSDPTHIHSTSVFHDYNNGHLVPVHNGQIVFPDGLTAHKVQITLVEPIHHDLPYNIKMTVHACIPGKYQNITNRKLISSQ